MTSDRYPWDPQIGVGYRLGGQPEVARRLHALFLAGRLGAGLYAEGLAYFGITPDRRGWRLFFERVLSLAGVLLFLAGLIMFLAWNWQDFPKSLKFALCEALFAGFGLLALTGRERWPGRLAALGAAIAGGAMLALHGQIYQTGANTWELFRAWCLLTLPFFLLRRDSGLGLLLWLTGSFWVALYQWQDFSHLTEFLSPYPDSFTVLQLFCWAFCETRHQLGRPDAGGKNGADGGSGWRRALFPPFDPLRWLTRCVGAGCLFLLTVQIFIVMIEVRHRHFSEALTYAGWIPLLYALALAALFIFYYRLKPDLFFLCLGVFSLACSAGARFLIWQFASAWRNDLAGRIVLSGLVIILLCLGSAKLIFLLRRNILFRQARLAELPDSPPADTAPAPAEAGSGSRFSDGSLLGNWALWRVRASAALHEWLFERAGLPEGEIADFFAADAARQEQAQPWYMKAFLAFGIWVGSLLLVGAFLLLFTSSVKALIVLGPLLCGVGAWLFRSRRFVARQLGLVLIFCGLGGIFALYFNGYYMRTIPLSLSCAVFLALWAVLPQTGARGICFALSLFSLYWLCFLKPVPVPFMFIPFFALPAFFGALRLAAWPPSPGRLPGPDFRRMDSGLPRALLDSAAGGSLLFLLGMSMICVSLPDAELWMAAGLPPVGSALVRGICAGLLAASLLSAVMRPNQRIVRLAAGVVLAALTWLFAPLGPGMALLLHARSRGSRLPAGAAAAYLGVAVTMFYYQINVSFLQKSLLLALSGLLLLGLSLVARKWFEIPPEASEADARAAPRQAEPSMTRIPRYGAGLRKRFTPDRLALLVVLLMILGAFNTAVFSKESLLRHGRVMLLELAPVDPLSLLQGYYMRLVLEAEREIRRNLPRRVPAEGRAVMVERDGISRFARLHGGELLAEGESLLVFRVLPKGRVRISSGSFFFEEGAAAAYDRARYAELRVDTEGEALIANLLDADRQTIHPAAPSGERP
jgi:uncharacterized membrane protein/uncharacterized membrane-anchored protein